MFEGWCYPTSLVFMEREKSKNFLRVKTLNFEFQKIFSKVLLLVYNTFGEGNMFPLTLYMWWV